jgi:hypothetical protein
MLEIHVVDLNCKPQEGLAYQIKKPDGGTESGKLDKDGRGKVKSSKPGLFTVTFPELDGADWDGDGAGGLPSEESRSEASRHKVEQGERLPTIARKYGFACWQTIWDFIGNLALKARRNNAHVLFPGDRIAIPGKLPRRALVCGGSAEYVVQASTEVLRVTFTGANFDAAHPVKFRAQPNTGPAVTGDLKPDGTMEIALREGITEVTVQLFIGDDDEPFETHELHVGGLDPSEEISGVQARLANLGYYDGEITGIMDDDTREAVARFRADNLDDDKGSIDAVLCATLLDEHEA